MQFRTDESHLILVVKRDVENREFPEKRANSPRRCRSAEKTRKKGRKCRFGALLNAILDMDTAGQGASIYPEHNVP
jgi:hypothetical protein